MLVELEIARARLAYRAGLAAAIRRQCGLEWTGAGYAARAKPRKVGMQEQIARIPKNAGKICVLWTDAKAGTSTVEFSPDGVRLFHVTVPTIEVTRYLRRAGRRKG
jgi:hypothetical protein